MFVKRALEHGLFFGLILIVFASKNSEAFPIVKLPTPPPGLADRGGSGLPLGGSGNPLGGFSNSLGSQAGTALSGCGLSCNPASSDFASCFQKLSSCKSGDLAKQVQSLLDTSGIKGIANQVTGSLDGVTKSINGITDEIKSVQDMIKNDGLEIGLSIGSGLALGGGLVSLGFEALSDGWSVLYEAITNEKDDARRIELFEKAREKWDEMNSTAVSLQNQIDFMLLMSDMAKASKTDRDKALQDQKDKKKLLTFEEGRVEKKLNQIRDTDEAYKQMDMSPAEVDADLKVKPVIKKTKLLEKIEADIIASDKKNGGDLSYLEDNRPETYNQLMACQPEDDLKVSMLGFTTQIDKIDTFLNNMGKYDEKKGIDDFCRGIKNYIQKLSIIEGEMQDVRGILVNQYNQKLFFKKLQGQIDEAKEGYNSLNSQVMIKGKTKKILQAEQADIDEQLDQYNEKKSAAIKNCVFDKIHKGIDIPFFAPVIDGVASAPEMAKYKETCTRDFDSNPKYESLRRQLYNNKIQMENHVVEMKKYDEKYKALDGKVTYNLQISQDRVKSYTEWFYQLALEQSCYNQTKSCGGQTGEKKCLASIEDCKTLGKDSSSLLVNLKRLADQDPKVNELCK